MTQDTQAAAGAQPAPAQTPEPLYGQAVHHAGVNPSVSYVQRKLGVGFQKTYELMERAFNAGDIPEYAGRRLDDYKKPLLDRIAELEVQAKHWRSNHDNVAARLRVFTQRPDIPKELADRLPWYRELVRLQAVEAQALRQDAEPAESPLDDSELEDLAHAANQEALSFGMSLDVFLRLAKTVRLRAAALQAAPPAPAAVAVPDEREAFDKWFIESRGYHPLTNTMMRSDAWEPWKAWQARAALAAAPAQDNRYCGAGMCVPSDKQHAPNCAAAPAQAAAWMTPEGDRVVTEATMAGARKDGGAMLSSMRPFTVALGRIAAPAQAVAVPSDDHAFDYFVSDCESSGIQYHGPSYERGFLTGKIVANDEFHEGAIAAQEHATQLAGPALRPYIGHVQSVADLVNNLLLLDQTLPIYGAQYIEHPPGKRRAIAVPPIVSREQVKDSRWIGQGDTLNAAVIWTRAQQPTAPAQAQEDAPALEAPAAPKWSQFSSRVAELAMEYGNARTQAALMGERTCKRKPDAVLADLRAALAAAPQAPAAPVAWLPYLSDRADGVQGHYAIARHNPAGYREVWNLRSHRWASASDEVLTLDEALAILQKLSMPTAAPAAPAVDAQEVETEVVGAMHRGAKGAKFSECIECGAIAEQLAKPCPAYMNEAAALFAANAAQAKDNAARAAQGDRDEQ